MFTLFNAYVLSESDIDIVRSNGCVKNSLVDAYAQLYQVQYPTERVAK